MLLCVTLKFNSNLLDMLSTGTVYFANVFVSVFVSHFGVVNHEKDIEDKERLLSGIVLIVITFLMVT